MDATWAGQLLVACLASGGLASHRSAAVLHGIDGYRPGLREVVVAERWWGPQLGVTVHRSRQMDRAEPTTRDHIPCTGLARTVLDLAAVVNAGQLADTVDAVLRDGRLELSALCEVLSRHSRRGRDGCGRLRSLLKTRIPGAGIPLSRWSRMVACLLADRSLPEPDLEHRIHDRRGVFLAQVDLAYPRQHVAIELDSISWHLNRESFQADRERWNTLTLEGWTCLSFTWADYASTPGRLVGQVRAALSRFPR